MTGFQQQKTRIAAALFLMTAVVVSSCVGSETVMELLPDIDTELASGEKSDGKEISKNSDTENNWTFEGDSTGCGEVILDIPDDFEFSDPQWLNALSAVTHVRGNLDIRDIDIDSETLDPLRSLRCVDGYFSLSNVWHLTNLDVFANLHTVGGDMVILDNDHLINLDALTSLHTIGGDLAILYNDNLPTLEGVQHIRELGGTRLYITYNSSLPTCDAQQLYDDVSDLGWDGEACIDDNSRDACDNIRQGCSSLYRWTL